MRPALRLSLASLAAFALCACFNAKLPPPPTSLTAALTAVGDAVEGRGSVGPACEKLSMELTAWEQSPAVPVRTKADLHRLMMEVAAYGAATDDLLPPYGPGPDVGRWNDIRGRLVRVLAGENPEPGSRYQLSQPQNVTDAFAAADAAAARGDVAALRSANGRLRGALEMWATKMPGPRGVRMMQAAERESIIIGGTAEELAEEKRQLREFHEAVEPARE